MTKYFIFGDVHGMYDALLIALEKEGFDPENNNHIIVSLGDNFDRGTQNLEMLNFLLSYWKKERLLHIMGNHDQMLLDFLSGKSDGVWDCTWNGLNKTLDAFSGDDSMKYIREGNENALGDKIRGKIRERHPEIEKLFESAVDKIELGHDYILTHGGYSDIGEPDGESNWVVDNWGNTEVFVKMFPESKIYDSEKIYVFGHWHTFRLSWEFLGKSIDETLGEYSKNHNVFLYKNFVGLDAASNLSGIVNVMALDDFKKYILMKNGDILESDVFDTDEFETIDNGDGSFDVIMNDYEAIYTTNIDDNGDDHIAFEEVQMQQWVGTIIMKSNDYNELDLFRRLHGYRNE